MLRSILVPAEGQTFRRLIDVCPRCRQQTLCEIDNKFWCGNCGLLEDCFQDGDRVEPG